MSAKAGANSEFEDQFWQAAINFQGTRDAAEYKHVVLGLILYTFWEDSDGLHIACSIPQKSIVYYRDVLQRQHF